MQSTLSPSANMTTVCLFGQKSKNSLRLYLIRFALLFSVIFSLTIIACNFLLLSSEEHVASIISEYLKNPFAACVYAKDYLSCIFNFCTPDMTQLLFLLCTNITFFCVPACTIFMVYRAFSLGLSASALSSFLIVSQADAPHIAMSWLFVLFYIMISFLFCIFSASICSASFEVRSGMVVLKRESKKSWYSIFGVFHKQLLRFLVIGGSIVLLKILQMILFSLIAG